MQEGTKKIFPTDYERFKEAMISAANDNSLPVALQLDDIRDYTLRDLQDAFSDFNMDTGLRLRLGNHGKAVVGQALPKSEIWTLAPK